MAYVPMQDMRFELPTRRRAGCHAAPSVEALEGDLTATFA